VSGGWPDGFGGCPKVVGFPPQGGVAGLEVAGDRSSFGWAVASRQGGAVHVWAGSEPTLEGAVGVLDGLAPVVCLTGITLKDQVLGSFPVVPAGMSETRVATPVLQDLVRRGVLFHDHGERLLWEVSGARVADVESGQVLSAKRSKRPIPVLKAVAWSVMGVESNMYSHSPEIW